MYLSNNQKRKMTGLCVFLLISASISVIGAGGVTKHDYGDALSKSILFFEGQRSGKLPSSQRVIWRKDSALHDGDEIGQVDLVGGYYDAGDNVKFNFPMAFSITMLAWSVLETGKFMGPDLNHALDAIKWGTDYLLKATSVPGLVFVQVGEPYADHNCWQRPEDMNTPRTPYAVGKDRPGSEVAAEIAAALAASSIVFKFVDHPYSISLLNRSIEVFEFANKYRGSYNDSLGPWVCPFYCDYSGYQDELLWAAAWLQRATKSKLYWKYIVVNTPYLGVSFAEFGWDSKHAGINILVSKLLVFGKGQFHTNANKFVCSVLPESPTRSVQYSPGGLLFKSGGSNMQHTTALSFLVLAYARYLGRVKEVIYCGNVVVTPSRLVKFAKIQVDYILGSNPMNMSYMVGYGKKFPQRIHHRGASIPSKDRHPEHIDCKGGSPHYSSKDSDPNLLVGAVVGGPDVFDSYADSRQLFVQSEPTTYINAPLVGLLAYFKNKPM